LAWCKVSSLTAAVARSLRQVKYPATRHTVIAATNGKVVEGWELSYFLGQALTRKRYHDLRSVMSDLEDWLEKQG
jgi:hypothetical protein